MTALNLLPERFRIAAARRRRVRGWLALGAVAGLLMFVTFARLVMLGHSAWQVSLELDALRAEYRAQGEQLTLANTRLSDTIGYGQMVLALDTRDVVSARLHEILDSVPISVVLDTVQIGHDGGDRRSRGRNSAGSRAADEPPDPTRDFIISVSGAAATHEALRAWIARLEASPSWERVYLVRVFRVGQGKLERAGFQLICSIREDQP